MPSDPVHPAQATSADRRVAVWPWLLLPLVALALFFALRTAKDAPPRATNGADAPAATAPGAGTESP